jgi:hypothetical protein
MTSILIVDYLGGKYGYDELLTRSDQLSSTSCLPKQSLATSAMLSMTSSNIFFDYLTAAW